MPGEPRTVFYTRTSGLEVKIPDWMVAGECSIYLKLRKGREPRSVLDTRTTALEVRIPQSGWSLAIVTSTMVSVNDRPYQKKKIGFVDPPPPLDVVRAVRVCPLEVDAWGRNEKKELYLVT